MGEKNQQKIGIFKVIAVTILVIIAVGIPFFYTINDDIFKEGVAATATYTSSAILDTERGILVGTQNEDGTISELSIEEIFESLEGADIYLVDDEESTKEEKLQYLLNAELVTKYPYLSVLEGDESKLNGTIKFYRYTNQEEVEAAEAEAEESADETEEDTFNPKELFYIGDSWMVGLRDYIKANVSDEYPGDNHFLCEGSQRPSSAIFYNDNLQEKIDAVSSEVSSIVIMLGLNGRDTSESDRMSEIIEFLATTYEDKTIYVLKVPHVGEEYLYTSSDGTYQIDAREINEQIDEYNTIIIEKCSQIAKAKFIDTTRNMMTEDLFLDPDYKDGEFHLNYNGKALWYNNIKECIREGRNSVGESKFLMTYINEEEFDRLMDQYEDDGNTEIYRYFTLNEEGKIVIAHGSKTTKTITTDDPENTLEVIRAENGSRYEQVGEGLYSLTTYSITKTPYDYQTLVSAYKMPFNLLWAFLVQTKDYEFVAEIANLAYETEIEIAIYDNESTSVRNVTQTYNKTLIYTENTVLSFPAEGDTTPSIDIESPNYSDAVKACYGYLTGAHYPSYSIAETVAPSLGVDRGDGHLYRYYISDTTADGIITGIASVATTFTKKIDTVSVAKTTPTLGVVLADTWIGKWEASYEIEGETTSRGTAPSDPVDEEYENVSATTQISSELLQGDGIIGRSLTLHSEVLKGEAIAQIIERTDFSSSVEMRPYMISLHLSSGCCSHYLQTAYGKTYNELSESRELLTAVSEIFATGGNDDGSVTGNAKAAIYRHVYNQQIVAQEEALKNEFEEELKEKISYSQWPTAQRAKTNVVQSSGSTKDTTKYDKDSTTREDEGKKFKEIIEKSKYYESRKAILNRTEWFWEYIRAAEDTTNLEDVLRYLFNQAFETDQFGEFSESQIKSIFRAFEPKTKRINMGHSEAFSQWLKGHENNSLRIYMNEGESGIAYENVERYVTEDGEYGKMYYTSNDGCWNFTYGIMVCNKKGVYNNVDIFADYGYDIEELVKKAKAGETVLVPMEDLEAIYEELIQRKRDYIKAKVEEHGVTMETWQYNALTSVSYQWGNCGEKFEDENNIAEVYKKYYIEEENPDEFKNNAVLVSSSGDLVKFFLGDKYSQRKEDTWILFTEGRYIIDGEEIFVSGDSAELILDTCAELTEELIANDVHYYKQNDVVAYPLVSGDIAKSSDFSDKSRGICCATYVGIVLYWAEILPEAYINKYNYNLPGGSMYENSIYGMLLDAGWEIVPEEDALAGDICVFCELNYTNADGETVDRMDHAFIYAGGNSIWDQNTGCVASDGTVPSGGVLDQWDMYTSQFDVIVFRAP